jgi:hypothetical protein
MGRVEEFWIQEGRRAVSSRKAQAARAVQLYWDAISRQMSWGAQCEVEWPLSGNGHVRGGARLGDGETIAPGRVRKRWIIELCPCPAGAK